MQKMTTEQKNIGEAIGQSVEEAESSAIQAMAVAGAEYSTNMKEHKMMTQNRQTSEETTIQMKSRR